MLSMCLLFCFVLFWIFCYVVCEKIKNKIVDNKKKKKKTAECFFPLLVSYNKQIYNNETLWEWIFAFVSIKKPLVFINLKLSQFTVYAYVDFFNIKCPKFI